VGRHRACLKEPSPGGTASPPGTAEQQAAEHEQEDAGPDIPDGPADGCGTEGRLVTRTRERHAAVHELLQAGESLHSISRCLSLSRPTVRRFARTASADELLDGATGKESKLDPFRPYLHQRWNEGVTGAAALHAELQERGFTGSVRTVRRYVAPFRQAAAAPDPAPAVPKTRQITRWLLTRPEHLLPEEQAQLAAIRASCPHIDALARHVASFAEMMTHRTGDRDLQAWLAAAEADNEQPELRSFAPESATTSRPSPTASPCPTARARSRAPSTRSRCSSARCTGAPDSPCSAPALSFTQSNHTIRGRADPDGRPQESAPDLQSGQVIRVARQQPVAT
jgi:hypothetical protein